MKKENKSVKAEETRKVSKSVAKKPVAKKKEVEKKQPEKVEVIKTEEKVIVNQPNAKEEPKKKITLNQELNLVIGLLALITIISFCFSFQVGDAEYLGWEIFLNAGEYSGVFKGLMILYVASIFIDCILAINIETENEVFNIVEKALYMFTLIMNFIVVAVLLSIITKIGTGLLLFFVLSIVSAIVKFARIYSKR